MFNFFSDVKNRLTALENEVKAIYAHLRGDVPNDAGVAEIVSVQPDTSSEAATTPTNNGNTPGTESN